MTKTLTLITMSQGNPQALRRTFESYAPYCQQIVYGDVLLFDEDREAVRAMQKDFPLHIVDFPFNFIFKHGFSAILNALAARTGTDYVTYANCSEIIDLNFPVQLGLLDDDAFNCFFFRHAVEQHRWVRTYNRQELCWSGMIHEEVAGERRMCPSEIFYMADTPKDTADPFKARVCDDVKEMVYFEQLDRLRQHPEMLGSTSQGWLDYTNQQGLYYASKQQERGRRFEAFLKDDLAMYLAQAALDFKPQ